MARGTVYNRVYNEEDWKLVSKENKNIMEDFLEEYRKKCFVLGKDIFVLRMNEKKPAKALRIDKDGHLVVRYNDGSVESLSSGEVSIRF